MTKHPGFFQGTEMPTAGWWEALWPDPAAILAHVGLAAGMSVIDLCSGDGWFTLPIARVASRVVALDIDADLLRVSDVRLREADVANVSFVAGDAYDVASLVREPVDFVFLANAFHGVPDKTRLARAVAQVLKPGGRFAVVNWHPRPREETPVLGEPRGPRTDLRISPQATVDAVMPSGLAFDRLVDVPPYHYAAVFRR
ncbi:MAG TPA: class I SAM-dependent methyltransferase [Alphaproteobacteria bacterium]|jgi:SAM-dependent methyltransferase|nr:class I SAM-dependent methyltransferase [Alphaproteobacteria bacterium]